MYNTYNPYNLYSPYYIPPVQTPMDKPQGLQGKSVDSLDVVKAMETPLDGSIIYYPLLDGSAIVTKQLQQDGTSKIVIYRPADLPETKAPQYVTFDDLKDVNSKEIKELKDELKTLKRQIRDLKEDKEE